MFEFLLVICTVIYWALLLYFFSLIARFVLDWVRVIRRDWRPQGALLVIAEVVFTITDPPLKLFRRIIPPLRMGAIAFDFAWSITLLLTLITMSVVRAIPYWFAAVS